MVWLEVFLLVMGFHVAWFCSVPMDTMRYVPSCPKSREEWKQRAALKNCSQFRKNSMTPTNFVYHCVINNFANATIEVCALEMQIIDHRCAEFNVRGEIITESYSKKCDSSCPFKYNSTDAYKYQVCYAMGYQLCSCNSTKQADSRDYSENFHTISSIRSTMVHIQEDTCSETRLYIVIGVCSALLMISILFNVWFLYRCKRKGKHLKGKGNNVQVTVNEFHPLLPSGGVNNNSEYVTRASEISEIQTTEGSKEDPFVIAIDIGEKYLGMAYIDPKNPKTVIPLHPMERISVLRRKTDKNMVVGSEATRQFIEMRDEDLKHYDYINEVKATDVSKEDAGKSFQPKDILVEAIKDALNLVWRKSNAWKNNQDIKLILSAADHWSTHSEQLKADIEKQMNPEHPKLRKERIFFMKKIKTVPPFIRKVQASSICLNFNIEHLRIARGTKYAVLNVGYGFCHLSFLEISLEENELDNIISGGRPRSEWGKSAPEENVWSYCNKILNEKYLTPQNHEKIKSQYDFHHETIRKCQDDETTFEFELIKDKLNGNFMTDEKVDGIEVKDNGNKIVLCFQWRLLKNCFKELMNKVDEVIENNRECGFERYAVKFVFIIGGYNNLNFIQDASRSKWFPNITVFIPRDGGVSFAMGAASACAGNLIK